MADTTNNNKDTEQQPDTRKDKDIHLLVSPDTRNLIEATRVAMRRTGTACTPASVSSVLEDEWTNNTMVKAGMAALVYLLEHPEPKLSPEAETYLRKLSDKTGLSMDRTLHSIIFGYEFLSGKAEEEAAKQQSQDAFMADAQMGHHPIPEPPTSPGLRRVVPKLPPPKKGGKR